MWTHWFSTAAWTNRWSVSASLFSVSALRSFGAVRSGATWASEKGAEGYKGWGWQNRLERVFTSKKPKRSFKRWLVSSGLLFSEKKKERKCNFHSFYFKGNGSQLVYLPKFLKETFKELRRRYVGYKKEAVLINLDIWVVTVNVTEIKTEPSLICFIRTRTKH